MPGFGLEYWKLGNAIAAFAVVQALAFAIAIGTQSDFRSLISRTSVRLLVGITALVTAAYLLALYFSFCAERLLLNSQDSVIGRVCLMTVAARFAAVVIVNCAVVWLMIALSRQKTAGETRSAAEVSRGLDEQARVEPSSQ